MANFYDLLGSRYEARERAAYYSSKPPDPPKYNAPSEFYGMSPKFTSAAKDWLESNKDNPAVGAAGADLAYNALTSKAQEDADFSYAKRMAPEALKFQRESQEIDSIAQDRSFRTQGDEQRKTVAQEGTEQRSTLTQATDETLRLRRDARNAIKQDSPFRSGTGRRYFA